MCNSVQAHTGVRESLVVLELGTQLLVVDVGEPGEHEVVGGAAARMVLSALACPIELPLPPENTSHGKVVTERKGEAVGVRNGYGGAEGEAADNPQR